MRISGGAVRGLTLDVPRGTAVRPATDGLRQALFSSLGARVGGSRVLDLFAGSGAYGLEALSRGASFATFVERHGRTAAVLRENLAHVAAGLGRPPGELGRVLTLDALAWAPAPGDEAPDLVFVDPPYEAIPEVWGPLFERLDRSLTGAVDPLVCFETPGQIRLEPTGWVAIRRLGGTAAHQPGVSVFRRSAAPSAAPSPPR
jgi:16S rRNA (guanine966-N2)-methyltransferase